VLPSVLRIATTESLLLIALTDQRAIASSSAGQQELAGDIGRLLGRQERHDLGDLGGLSRAAGRTRATSLSSTSGGIACVIGVSTRPGATALTRTCGAQRSASARVTPTSADFAAT